MYKLPWAISHGLYSKANQVLVVQSIILFYVFSRVVYGRKSRGYKNLCQLPGALPVHSPTNLTVNIATSCYIVLTYSLY